MAGQAAGAGSALAAGEDALARERASTVIVWAHIADHRDAETAGVIVGASGNRICILTARHTVAAGTISVLFDGHLYPAELRQTYPHRDLAVIEAIVPAGEEMPLVRAATTSVTAQGEPIDIWGADNYGPRPAHGTVIATRMPAIGDAAAPDVVGIKCDQCRPGDAGAGVYDPSGNLIAIVSARYRGPDGSSIALVAEPVDEDLLLALR
jgi:S1-C subfamily serine protease